MISSGGVPPSPESSVVRRSPHRITLLNLLGFPSHEVPAAPACTEYRPRPHTAWPLPSEAAGTMSFTGRVLLALSRLAVSPRPQPVKTGVCQPRLVAPALHPTHAPMKGHAQQTDRNRPGRHKCAVDDRSSNLSHSPSGPDRTSSEEKAHSIQHDS